MILVSLFGMLLCGFSSLSDELKERLQKMPQHYENFDVKMGWSVVADTGATTVSGVLKNVRYATMEEIEIWVAVLDSSGKVVKRSVDNVVPRRIDRDDVAAFRVVVPVAAAPGTRLQFTYKYLGFDGGGNDGDGTGWMQSFEVTVPSGK
jgi:hypothetical protein